MTDHINAVFAFSDAFFKTYGADSKSKEKIPSGPTRLKAGGTYNGIHFDYGRVLEFLIALPAEIQLPILEHVMSPSSQAQKRRHEKSMKNIFLRWVLCHRRLTPQVIDVWWKRNTILIRGEWMTVVGDGNEFRRLKERARYLVAKLPPSYARSMIRSVRIQMPQLCSREAEIFIKLLRELGGEKWPRLKRLEISVHQWDSGNTILKTLITERIRVNVQELILLPAWYVNVVKGSELITVGSLKHLVKDQRDQFMRQGWLDGWERRVVLRDALTPDSEDKYERMLEILQAEQGTIEQQLAFEGGWLCSHLK